MIIKHIEIHEIVSISGILYECIINRFGFPERDKITHVLRGQDGSEVEVVKDKNTYEFIAVKERTADEVITND